LEGQRLRSRIKQFEEGEKPTRFFFRSEREEGKKKLIREIRKKDGDIASETDEITEVFRDFYAKLFTKDQLDPQDRDYFLSKLEETLPEEISDQLERPISAEELLTALKSMANSKTPGSDGLPKEFYLQFWDLLGPDMLEVFKEGLQDGLLAPSQRQGIITLLEKKGDQLNPANKRPISLLNVDYKILSKVLANRLKAVIGLVVHTDQSCGIPGRSISDSVCLLRDIAAYVNDKDLPCVFLALDQEKAFDRVDHDFMVSILERLGFGPTFRQYIASLYSEVSSKVLVNGSLSSSIPVERGVRQGCPLSPLLYVLCIEPLAAAIRADTQIKGVHLPGGSGRDTKIVQYADDNTVVLTDSRSIDRTFELISKYESGTGAKLNLGKTVALWLGCWRGRQDQPYPIGGWSSSHLKILGSPVGNQNLAEEAWLQRFAKFKATLEKWKDRKLTLFGKVLVINSLAAATLWYVAPVYPLSRSVQRKIEKLMFEFLWDGKTELVNRKTLYLSKEEGGLGLVCIPLKAKALLLKSVKKALTDPEAPTSRYAHYWLGLSLRQLDPESWNNNIPHSMERPPHFESIFGHLKDLETKDVQIDWKSCTTKSLYDDLLKAENIVPRCVQNNPTVRWKDVWKAIHNPLIQKWDRMLAWHAAHNSLKTRQKLKSWRGFVDSDVCPRRGCNMVESVTHLFWECPVVAEVWEWVEGLIYRRLLPQFNMPGAFAVYGLVFQSMPTKTRLVLETLAAMTRSLLWKSRCEVIFEKKHFMGHELITRLQKMISERLDFEFARLSPAVFYDTWVEGHTWIDFDISHIVVHL